MKNKLQICLMGFLCLIFNNAFAAPPNDDCVNAISLTVSSNCSTISGTTAAGTQSMSACAGTADEDVWYKFVATNNNATITVLGSSYFDAVVQLFNGGCATSSLQCVDGSGQGGTEIITATGLVVGTTYYLRVYEYYSGVPSTSTFTICVTSIGTPLNDDCNNASHLPVVSSKNTTTAGSVLNATQSLAGCAGTANDDVWYKFIANATKDSIYVTSSFDPVVQVLSGSCAGTSIACIDNSASGIENVYLTALTVGQTYYVRVYDYYSGTASNPTFSISIYKFGSVVSGTEEALTTSKLSLYPNPAKNELNMNLSAFDAEVSLEIIDAKGNRVMQQSLNGGDNSSVNVESLENGVYLAKISSGSHFSTERFVIMK